MQQPCPTLAALLPTPLHAKARGGWLVELLLNRHSETKKSLKKEAYTMLLSDCGKD